MRCSRLALPFLFPFLFPFPFPFLFHVILATCFSWPVKVVSFATVETIRVPSIS